MAEDDQSNILTFQDKSPSADPIFEYPESIQNEQVPIVIDNGACKCRAGWASESEPRLIFKNLIAKQRSKKSPDTIEIQIGNDINNIEVVRWQLKSQFDKNVVTHYDSQEQILDYTFSHLGINSSGSVDHPIVMTEAMSNPNYCRKKMSELLFECYHIPKVTYGVDSLFSFYKNHPTPERASTLLVSCGYSTTHVLPVLDGRLQAAHGRRISIGGATMEAFLHKTLQLKYPGHMAHITLGRAEEILHKDCRMAVDYLDELKAWENEEFYVDHVLKYQLPFTAVSTSVAAPEQQKERRDQQIRRLKELNARKREAKLAAEQEKLEHLLRVQELIDDEDEELFQRALRDLEMKTVSELQDEITRLNASIQKIKYKMAAEEAESKGVDLLDVPDDRLNPEQREVKKRQRLMKSASDPQLKKPRVDRRLLELEEAPYDDPEAMTDWVKRVRNKRQDLIDLREDRKRRKTEMTKRRTHASQQRMKIITELARGNRKKKEDTFGQNDDDWNVYKEINKDAGDSDSEAEQEQLEELETLLREYDPSFKDPNEPDPVVDLAEYYRVHVGVEQIRVPELLFQPSMSGLDQAGIAETIQFVLSKFTPEQQNKLVQCVFLTGGCANFPNLESRLEEELRTIRPFQSTFKVFSAQDSVMDAWYGARKFALSPEFAAAAVSRQEYEEYGGEYLKEFFASNRYTPSPPAAPSTGAQSEESDCKTKGNT